MSAAMTLPTSPDDRSKKLADLAAERALRGKVSPELEAAASAAVAPWAKKLVKLLDDWMIDPIVGFILPGAGDAITGTGSVALLFLALKERVPTVVIGKMVANILVDTIGGFLPFLGDAFDVVWRSNKRNLRLIEEHGREGKKKPSKLDYVLVGGGVVLAILSVLIPVLIVYGIGASLLMAAFGE